MVEVLTLTRSRTTRLLDTYLFSGNIGDIDRKSIWHS